MKLALVLFVIATPAFAQHDMAGMVPPGPTMSQAQHERDMGHGLPPGGGNLVPADGVWISVPATGSYKLSGDLFAAKAGELLLLYENRVYYVKPFKPPLMWLTPGAKAPTPVPAANLYPATIVKP